MKYKGKETKKEESAEKKAGKGKESKAMERKEGVHGKRKKK